MSKRLNKLPLSVCLIAILTFVGGQTAYTEHPLLGVLLVAGSVALWIGAVVLFVVVKVCLYRRKYFLSDDWEILPYDFKADWTQPSDNDNGLSPKSKGRRASK